jgi:hypothetical protein
MSETADLETTSISSTAPEAPSKHRWTAKGEVAEGGKEKDIKIFECDRCITDVEKNVYGKPIGPKLGSSFIRHFWDRVRKTQMLSFYDEMKKKLLHGQQLDDDTDKMLKGADDWLKTLLARSFALTYDKSVLLKILSQPECEGIRIYLALKGINHQEAQSGYGPCGTFTFVSVGVDKEGKDLRFKGPVSTSDAHAKDEKSGSSLDSSLDVENTSLCGEYPGQPVSMDSFNTTTGPRPKHPQLYGLYHYASEGM